MADWGYIQGGGCGRGDDDRDREERERRQAEKEKQLQQEQEERQRQYEKQREEEAVAREQQRQAEEDRRREEERQKQQEEDEARERQRQEQAEARERQQRREQAEERERQRQEKLEYDKQVEQHRQEKERYDRQLRHEREKQEQQERRDQEERDEKRKKDDEVRRQKYHDEQQQARQKRKEKEQESKGNANLATLHLINTGASLGRRSGYKSVAEKRREKINQDLEAEGNAWRQSICDKINAERNHLMNAATIEKSKDEKQLRELVENSGMSLDEEEGLVQNLQYLAEIELRKIIDRNERERQLAVKRGKEMDQFMAGPSAPVLEDLNLIVHGIKRKIFTNFKGKMSEKKSEHETYVAWKSRKALAPDDILKEYDMIDPVMQSEIDDWNQRKCGVDTTKRKLKDFLVIAELRMLQKYQKNIETRRAAQEAESLVNQRQDNHEAEEKAENERNASNEQEHDERSSDNRDETGAESGENGGDASGEGDGSGAGGNKDNGNGGDGNGKDKEDDDHPDESEEDNEEEEEEEEKDEDESLQSAVNEDVLNEAVGTAEASAVTANDNTNNDDVIDHDEFDETDIIQILRQVQTMATTLSDTRDIQAEFERKLKQRDERLRRREQAREAENQNVILRQQRQMEEQQKMLEQLKKENETKEKQMQAQEASFKALKKDAKTREQLVESEFHNLQEYFREEHNRQIDAMRKEHERMTQEQAVRMFLMKEELEEEKNKIMTQATQILNQMMEREQRGQVHSNQQDEMREDAAVRVRMLSPSTGTRQKVKAKENDQKEEKKFDERKTELKKPQEQQLQQQQQDMQRRQEISEDDVLISYMQQLEERKQEMRRRRSEENIAIAQKIEKEVNNENLMKENKLLKEELELERDHLRKRVEQEKKKQAEDYVRDKVLRDMDAQTRSYRQEHREKFDKHSKEKQMKRQNSHEKDQKKLEKLAFKQAQRGYVDTHVLDALNISYIDRGQNETEERRIQSPCPMRRSRSCSGGRKIKRPSSPPPLPPHNSQTNQPVQRFPNKSMIDLNGAMSTQASNSFDPRPSSPINQSISRSYHFGRGRSGFYKRPTLKLNATVRNIKKIPHGMNLPVSKVQQSSNSPPPLPNRNSEPHHEIERHYDILDHSQLSMPQLSHQSSRSHHQSQELQQFQEPLPQNSGKSDGESKSKMNATDRDTYSHVQLPPQRLPRQDHLSLPQIPQPPAQRLLHPENLPSQHLPLPQLPQPPAQRLLRPENLSLPQFQEMIPRNSTPHQDNLHLPQLQRMFSPDSTQSERRYQSRESTAAAAARMHSSQDDTMLMSSLNREISLISTTSSREDLESLGEAIARQNQSSASSQLYPDLSFSHVPEEDVEETFLRSAMKSPERCYTPCSNSSSLSRQGVRRHITMDPGTYFQDIRNAWPSTAEEQIAIQQMNTSQVKVQDDQERKRLAQLKIIECERLRLEQMQKEHDREIEIIRQMTTFEEYLDYLSKKEKEKKKERKTKANSAEEEGNEQGQTSGGAASLLSKFAKTSKKALDFANSVSSLLEKKD